MKFNLKKKNLKQLNRNVNDLEKQQTPHVAGGAMTDFACLPTGHICNRLSADDHKTCLC
ncbi:hypothetical protein [Pseudoalteromonas phenolica]|uniref:hypothetical protein n=1 Tax=Pseudoalteromonas phenolica TaxID=161398 RepID=UPI00384BF440